MGKCLSFRGGLDNFEYGTNKSLGIKIYLRKCESKPSVTSAIKELDTKDLIKGDLLFVNGHVLSNIKISKAIEEHQKRRSL